MIGMIGFMGREISEGQLAIEMQTSLVNSFCTENGSQFDFAPHPQSAKPRSVTCIFPNPPDVARPYDFQSAGCFLGVSRITLIWRAPLRMHSVRSARSTIRTASRCSILSGLRYPTAEW